MKELIKFKALGLSEVTLKALNDKGFEEPTKIQEKCIPILLKGNIDIVGQAQTGTGKTAAFGLPIVEIVKPEINKVQALILAPTRELAIQISEEINSLKGTKNIKIIPIYGGQSIEQQMKKLREGVHIVVGTPGRIIDHIKRKKLILDYLSFLILDEADEMLNMGFIEDVEKILSFTPKEKRMLLFSATMPNSILNLAKKYMPKHEFIEIKKEQLTANLTDQIYFEVMESNKFESLCRIIDIEDNFYGLVFCRTRVIVDKITHQLISRGYDAEGIHGDIAQSQREKIFGKFKNKRINILVATDVAARGIDVNDLTHVINYSLPQDPENYIHRIGRTGRAGKEGTAITFITPFEYRSLMYIRNKTKIDIRKEKLPEIKDIIKAKKERVVNKINEIVTIGNFEKFEKLALDIIKNQEPQKIIAALLKHSFKNELDENSYSEISEDRRISVDKAGTTRLFVAKGSGDGMDKKRLVEYITQKSGVKRDLIDDVQVLDLFSFVTVPFREAEIIIRTFKNLGEGQKPMISKAKPKNDEGASRGRSGNFNRSNNRSFNSFNSRNNSNRFGGNRKSERSGGFNRKSSGRKK